MKIVNINSDNRFKDPSIRIIRLTGTSAFVVFTDPFSLGDVRFEIDLKLSQRIKKFPTEFTHITNHTSKYLEKLLFDLNIMSNKELDNWIKSKEIIEKFNL